MSSNGSLVTGFDRVNPPASRLPRFVAASMPVFRLDPDHHSVMVSSARRGEGKSIVSSGMAWCLSEGIGTNSPKRVVLVDCNLRAPALHQLCNITNIGGVADVLGGRMRPLEAVQPVRGNLSLLPAGSYSQRAFRRLNADTVRTLLSQLREAFDVIIVDSAAVLEYPDSARMSGAVDGVLLVAESESTTASDLKQARRLLEKGGGRVSGVILNRASSPLTVVPTESEADTEIVRESRSTSQEAHGIFSGGLVR